MTIKYLDPITQAPVTVVLQLSVVNLQSILSELNRLHNVTKERDVYLNVHSESMPQLALFQALNINLHYN